MRNLAAELQASYDHATMRETARHVKSPENWQKVQHIQKRHEVARGQETGAYRDEYSARMADARMAITKERGERHYTHPAPRSADMQGRFSKTQIERQAHLRVQNAHGQTMAKINVSETRALKTLVEQSRAPQQNPAPIQPEFRRAIRQEQ